MKILGKKEIKEAMESIQLNKNQYYGYEVDEMILKHHKISTSYALEDVAEDSGDFLDMSDVYGFVDELMEQKGYYTDDGSLYIKEVSD